MINLYGYSRSGNCYKCSLIMTFLGIPFEWHELDVVSIKTNGWPAELVDKNPNAKMPFIEIEPNLYLSESNAILHYIAHGTDWSPQDRLDFAKMQQWMFFEQYSHEPALAVARYWLTVSGTPEKFAHLLPEKQRQGDRVLKIMDDHLATQARLQDGRASAWFVGASPTLADIALYAYTHVAHEGGFDLSLYPHIQTWLNTVASLPNYASMADLKKKMCG